MRGPVVNAGLAAISLMGAFTVAPRLAHADITFYDKDGWSIWTNGRAATHLQYITGDAPPAVPTGYLVGWENNAAVNESNSIVRARIGSGWVGTQLGFGVANQLNETTKLKAYFAVSLADITNNREKTQGKGVDYREAFASAEGTFGSVTFGRALSIFGTGLAGTIYMYSYGNGAGHPCNDMDGIAITCGPVNAGGIFPGFNAQILYALPAMGALGVKVALVDPSLIPHYTLRPFPRVEGEVTYDIGLGGTNKVSLIGQGIWQTIGRVVGGSGESANVLGGIAAARLEHSGFRVGVGGWGGKGLGTGVPMQGEQAVDANGKLRSFVGVMAHGNYMMGDWEFGAGFGMSNVTDTDADQADMMHSLIKSNTAFHGVVYRHFGPLILGAEFMDWMSEWHRGEEQTVQFTGLSANLLW